MLRSAPSSTALLEPALSGRASMRRATSRTSAWPWLLTAALILAYALPWLVTDVAALTFGGYDLAEWSTLPPAVRATEPPLQAALMLRLILTAIPLLLALMTGYRRISLNWWISLVVVVVLAAAQLPPLEFFTVARNDANYGQQFALAAVTLVLGVGLLLAPIGRWRAVVAAAVTIAGAILAYAGAAQSLELVRGYDIEAQMGGGVWIAVALFVIAALLNLAAALNGENKKSSVLRTTTPSVEPA